MSKIKIAPSILSGDFAAMGNTVESVCRWGADYVHVDVMDGTYVPNLTFGMPMVKAIKPYASIPLDVHLMIVNPEKYAEQFVRCGADIVSIHPEASADPHACIQKIRNAGAKAGIALNPNVGAEIASEFLEEIDMIILMGVYPGFGGQKYIESVNEKILQVRAMIDMCGRAIELELDGGVTVENAQDLVRGGVNVLVGGNAVFGSADPAATVCLLRGNS